VSYVILTAKPKISPFLRGYVEMFRSAQHDTYGMVRRATHF